MWLFHPNFKKVFSFFGLIPFISTVFLAFSFFICALVDGAQGIAFKEVDIGFIRFILWILIGGVACSFNFCFLVLLMSPMMAKFDAIMDIRNKV